MMKLYVLVVSILGYFSVSVGQFVQNGQCDPNIQLAANFNIEDFLGDWYEIARTENPYQNGVCSTIRFSKETTTSTTIDVSARLIRENFLREVSGTATQVTGQARFNVNIPTVGTPFEWSVIMTDHEHFAIAYSCVNLNNQQRSVYAWQLGRQPGYLNDNMAALMNNTMNNVLGINAAQLESISHTEQSCYILPVINPGQPIVLPGQCDPDIPVQQNFDVPRFLGLWHEVSSYHSESALGTCNRAEYSLGDGVVNVLNSQVVNQALDTIDGYARVTSNDGSARLSVVLNLPGNVVSEMPLYVIATDYTQYAISYTCVNLENYQKRVYSWILSRTRRMSESASVLVNDVVNSIVDLNDQYYQTTDQSDAGCFFFPEAVPDQPVVFRGQCDESIPAMPNFDPVRYMGLWHDIESYPTEFQFGTCANAFYTLVDGQVDVFNTQVVNQTLDTINGNAVITSTDGSAKLSVTFPIPGTDLTTVTNYWVINTDYDNYAVVYSCRNINDDEMQVTSWKLSRTKSLLQQSIAAINNAIQNINVLDNRYYQAVDQSVEGCFYFPEPQPGVPVVFPGQCDNTIPVVMNFNLQQFSGTWYEIQAYPKEQQPGQCINHQFIIAGANGYNIVSFNVDDQFLGVSTGTATFTGGTTEGRFNIVLPGNIVIPYWILRTDYVNYALAYSCINIGQDFRGVWSWKLSRTNELSAAANTNLNQVIESIEVLDNVYYEDIDQSDEACFYLPEIPPGDPIILPGQCDESITGVQNFDAARYLGRWRLIEAYASDSQSGTCEEANYSLAEDNTVIVYNTEIINQQLVSITGSATLASTDSTGVLSVTFPDIPGVFRYYILDTDYDSFALVYGCNNINADQRRIWSWKMSRTNTLSQNAIERINQVISSVNVLNNRYYQTVDRSPEGCFYYPEPDVNNVVVFPGQCDESIAVVTNFNAVAYMGLWHDISRYPVAFQNGTCGNAFYTLTDAGVDVFNTQVVNQALDTINGIAIPSADDGSAKLDVTFPIVGTPFNITTNYWVLSTDYSNYALVYSCTNIDEERRQVSSWKLSRTKSLSAAANTAMQTVIDRVQVLDDRYYIPQDQTPEGCFYFPEPLPGVPVVFPGQCDENIPVVTNFNMAQFSGIWYEVEAYPKDDETGQCVNHDFTVQSNTAFNLQSSSVTNSTLGITNSNMGFASNDNSASFYIILSVDGNTIMISYKILNTDYTNYALAYSCFNLNSDFRAVYSWKLSRTKSLTTSSITAINNAIANINVLDNVYFEPIDQSDNACFYFPEVAPGETVEFPGQCDRSIAAVQNFNAAAYLGRWKLIETYPSEFQLGECNDATYTLGANNVVDVFNTEVANQTLNTIVGTAVVSSVDQSGQLSVNFPDAPEAIEYLILDTDYTSFTVVYSCVNVGTDRRRVWGWKMSRTDSLSQNAVARIEAAMARVNVLDDRYFQIVDRSPEACFYFPEPDSESTVVFRGQCDESIAVVTNFNAVAYMGLWHDVSRYPVAFQNGTCGNAFYTLTDAGVDVYNTQVINQALDSINGIAVPSTNDGSAKLDVTFPIIGTDFTITTKYWVLSTDYSNYALVYSCQNIDAEYRQVSSWKLSRTKALSAAANTAMQTVIDRVQVLDDRYYVPQDQTPEGCFYFPEPQPGVPVVFPGQCDESIPVVTNFNMAQFSGIWYEVEAYPKDDETGQCVNHDFTVQSNTAFNLQSSSITNSTLGITNSNMVFVSNDNSASFNIILSVDGGTITIPYKILSTDYSSYALAYSCVNRNNDFRAVYSWKLSRTKSLTTSSITAINNAIANINVLDNVYFEPIDQSDNACFYFPEVAPGETVEFPGQCDRSIAAVQNFNAAAYLGRWKLIETYPSEFQLGECNDATYTLGANNVVDVFNTEVVNQTLNTIVGTAVVSSVDQSGQLTVNFPDAPEAIEYLILDTDYTSFTVVYSCVNVGSDRRRVWGWKMSRTDSLSQNAVARIEAAMARVNVLDDRYFQIVDRSPEACFYFPAPDNESPVVFRGQCDESIAVVTNFNAVAYMGLWHDVSRYPVAFQNGTCGNAFYTLTDAGVDVYNTQVINQALDTINGIAVPSTNDGSAKLDVTFPIIGTDFTITTKYWVLATDYSNYALVYSCQNLDDEYRQVSSWKLSRTKSLSAAANTAMQTVIDRVQVLDDRYYVPQDQTPEGCFYYPEPQPGVPVVFPGQCDESIPVVTNFNMAQFQGIWYEIEAYPKDDQPGQCINHDWSIVTSTTYSLQSSNVLNLTLGITNSNVRLATINPNVASFFIDISVDGSTISIPYRILSTDYNNYALAYSCMNLNSDFRAIYSWKLSRTKTLSTASTTAINNALGVSETLDNRYFETVDQSDDACFYLPDLGPGEPVIFPGQCETNVPVTPNFDPARYLGRWKLIETYPSNFQLGDCADATYTLDPNGTVVVYNTEVVGDTLSYIYGLATLDSNAKLIVTFPDAPEPIEYYILDTDYESYSLVYSCSNLDNNRRRVWSWKMSRTDTLSQNAINNIQAVMDNINVLDDRYFESVHRDAESCFYFPEPGTDPVTFRGQCDNSIRGIAAFDPVRYMGLWHDIESYPAPFQTGTCPNAQYTLNADGTVSVYNTQVVDQVLDVMSGTAVVASNDGTAWLRVTFIVGGQSVTTDYYVLATDYVGYALVYSCENVDSEYRRVFSWKLSRSQTLSNAASNAIQQAMNNVQVLRNDYFLPRGQSEDDCFYYPDNMGGDVILSGQCVPDNQVESVANFVPSLFAGTWHEVARFPSGFQNGECVASEYALSGANSFAITYTTVRDERQLTTSTTGSLPADGRGVISLTIDGVPFENVHILATDYTDYALAYACRNLDEDYKQVYSWKFSRNRSGLSLAANNTINNIVSDNIDLWEGYYEETLQTNDACFYYPVFDTPPNSIVLPGPCNTTIRGIPNFNAVAYMGRWIEISKYPQPDQFGTCDRAEYSLNGGFVDVVNTQVVDQRLLTQLGQGTVTSTDGSAELDVVFNVNGVIVNANYYVLATDYTNYALVYSCRNLDNNMRQVGSWKLSRTTSLSVQENNAMGVVISNTQGLLEDYYITTSQSDSDCFYIPELNVNEAPVFRGQCESVTGVQNFDVQRYMGWWHEIERYPTNANAGECRSSRYEQSGNQYSVIDTSVSGGNGQVLTGTVQASSNGVLTRTMSDGTVEEIVVLATDYDTYALLYSCVNVDNERRRVWSAKHSKNLVLTPASQDIMAQYIDNSPVLDSRFYLIVEQSDSSCFHYPTLTGQSVILRGQCDMSIPAVQNFDVAAYGGTWYQIERYPQIHESGDCTGARYTLDPSTGIVDVLNWEVIDGVLDTINGTATVVSTDGSARLSVILPIRGTDDTIETPLYVLVTDYDSYSLAYSCVNINSFERQIGAWKLSRERTMPQAGVTAINAYMQQREELYQTFFNQVEQSEDCEEPSAGFLFKSSIIVLTICVLLQMIL